LSFWQVYESQITAPSKRAATVLFDAENIAKTSRALNDIGTKSCLTLALAGGGLLTFEYVFRMVAFDIEQI
jgi:hypothetical protein